MNEEAPPLQPESAPTEAPPPIEHCRNCDAALTGAYCACCGQAAQLNVLSLWALGKELSGDLFNWDSRLWRTLRPLAFRPGFLTLEYLPWRGLPSVPVHDQYRASSLHRARVLGRGHIRSCRSRAAP